HCDRAGRRCRAENDRRIGLCPLLRGCAQRSGGAHPVVDHALGVSAAVLRTAGDARGRDAVDRRRSARDHRLVCALCAAGTRHASADRTAAETGGDRALSLCAQSHLRRRRRGHPRPGDPVRRLASLDLRRALVARVPRLRPGLRGAGVGLELRRPVRGFPRQRPALDSAAYALARSTTTVAGPAPPALRQNLIPPLKGMIASSLRISMGGSGKEGATMDQALSGVRVIDMTHNQAGPACPQILGFLGADVIKLEEPKDGDVARVNMRDHKNSDSLFFLILNANKRSLTLNLKTDAGKDLFRKVIAQSDVLVENFGPGALDRLG